MNESSTAKKVLKKGFFITFEGIEGCGKTTHMKLLADFLRKNSYMVVQTREPGGTPLGESIRKILKYGNNKISPLTETLLFASARAQLIHEVILPALSAGKIVISDRFMDSSLAYQGYGRNLGTEKVIAINRFALSIDKLAHPKKYLMPDITFLLDIPVDVALLRINSRYKLNKKKMDRFEKETLQFYQSVRKGYLALASRWTKRYCIIDATADINVVTQQIKVKIQHVISKCLY